MKISKIFAGMSAAAMLAAMTASIPAIAEDEVKELAKDKAAVEINVAKDQWSDGLDATKVPWQATKPWDVIQGYGTITVEAQVSNLDATLASGESLDFTDLATTFYGMDTTNWNWVSGGDATFDADGKATFTVDASTLNPKEGAEVQIGLQVRVNDQSKVAIDDKVTFDLDYTMTYVPAAQEEIVYNLPQTITDDADYAGDWGGDGYVDWARIKNLPEGESLDVTIKYSLLNNGELNGDGEEYSYFLAKPFAMTDGWPGLYAEGTKDWIEGVELKSSFTAEELEEHGQNDGTPVLQDDGYFIFYGVAGTEQELTFTLTADAIAKIKETYEDDNNGEYGGFGFQVYGVNITEVTVEETPKPVYSWTAFEMYAQDDWSAGNWGPVADGGLGQDAEVSANQTTYTVGYGPVYYAEDGETIQKEENGEAVGFYGTKVWCVDIRGLAESAGCSTKGLDLTTNAEKQELAESVGIDVTNVKLLVDGQEVATIPDDKVYFADHEGKGDLRIEIFNPGGSGETAVEGSDYYVAEVAAAADAIDGANLVEVSFDITGVPEEPVEPTPETPEEPTTPEEEDVTPEDEEPSEADEGEDEEPEEEEEEEEESSKKSKKSTEGDDGKKGSTATGNAGTSNKDNPKTGAAALALGTIALAGAAVVVSKRK
ncbi:MAG: NPXTG-anchored protein [Ruminococcus sp.]|nr:NPXTG-anchored protein [Ruminococcus sp.]